MQLYLGQLLAGNDSQKCPLSERQRLRYFHVLPFGVRVRAMVQVRAFVQVKVLVKIRVTVRVKMTP